MNRPMRTLCIVAEWITLVLAIGGLIAAAMLCTGNLVYVMK